MRTELVAEASARMTRAVLPVFAPLLRDEELLDAFEEVRSILTPEVERLVTTLAPDRPSNPTTDVQAGGAP